MGKMYYELKKSQKKIARIVMDRGLENHHIRALYDAESILQEWHNGKFKNAREAYMKMFQSIKKSDCNIARIYNDKGGSRWVEVMAFQIKDGVIAIEDLKDFDEEVSNTIKKLSSL